MPDELVFACNVEGRVTRWLLNEGQFQGGVLSHGFGMCVHVVAERNVPGRAVASGDEGVNVVGRTIDTHVFGLRKKLGEHADMIETIRGVGYRVGFAGN